LPNYACKYCGLHDPVSPGFWNKSELRSQFSKLLA
jgi:hypothetical protein